MAKSVVAFELTANASQAEGSVKSLKAQLREAQQDVQLLSEKFGATSQEAIKAAQRAAELKDAIGDAKSLTDAFNPDAKFKAFGAALQGVAGGFAAVQGAQALLGSESEDLEKVLVKVQGAMALSQGLNALGEAGDAFKILGAKAIQAFNGIKAAIGSTGIGLLLIAVGSIAAYWDDIKGAISGVSDETRKAAAEAQKKLEKSEGELNAVDKTSNILKLQGKSEKDILKIKLEKIKVAIHDAKINVANQQNIAKGQVAAEKRNFQILKNISRGALEMGAVSLRLLAAPLDLLIKTANSVSETLGFGKITALSLNEEISKLTSRGAETLSKLIFDPEKTAADGEKTVNAAVDKLQSLENEQAGFMNRINDINNEGNKKSINDNKKSNVDLEALRKQKEADEKARLENLVAQNKHTDELIQENRLSAIKDEFAKRQMELATQEQKEIDDELERLNKKLITQEQYEINRNNIVQKYANLQAEIVNAEETKRKEKEDADKKKRLDEEKEYNEAVLQAEAELQEEKWNIVSGGISALQTLAQGNEKLSNILFAVEKAAAIAKIVVNTQNEIAGYYANPTWSLMPDGGLALKTAASLKAKIRAGISIGTILATTIAKYKNGGGGGNVPTPPNQIGMNAPLTPQVQTTNLNQGQINQLASATSRAFVLESDVSGNQERIRRINRAARIN